MDGLILGLDLCDSYTQISCDGQEESCTFPTVICKKKEEDGWCVGEPAYECALEGEGIIIDKLLQLVRKEGTSTIFGTKYEGIEILKKYLDRVIRMALETYGGSRVQELVITLPKVEGKLMDAFMHCADFLELPRTSVHIISHAESFAYYVLSQKKEVWNNQIGMFELSEESLCYYEMKVQRGLRQTTVLAERERLEEGFNLDILNTNSGMRLADKILCSCGERLLQKKLFSSVFLTGKGFMTQDWAGEFMKLVCARRRVYVEPAIFSKGAAYKAADSTREKTSYPYLFICDGRLDTTVSVKVMRRDQENQLILAAAGDSWYESKSTVDFILDHQNYIEFMISPMDPKKRKVIKLTLDDFPERSDKTVKIQVDVGFLDENTMVIAARDKGFGELFPATDAVIRQEVML